MQNKGLSDVVTTVLIILLVLAAVAIIASYVLNAVNKGGAEVGGSAECTLLQLYPTECRYTRYLGADGVLSSDDTYNLDLKATKKGSDTKVKQLDILFTDKASGDVMKRQNGIGGVTILPLGFLETSTIYYETGISQEIYNSRRYSSAGVAVTIVPQGGVSSVTCNPSKFVECIFDGETTKLLTGGSPPGGSSQGSPITGRVTFNPSPSQVSSGFQQPLSVGERIAFENPVTGEEHTVTTSSVTSTSAVLMVQSDPINVTLSVGEEKKVNTSSSTTYDLYLKLNSITGGVPDVTVKTIEQPTLSKCGDGICEANYGENFTMCPTDCTPINSPPQVFFVTPTPVNGSVIATSTFTVGVVGVDSNLASLKVKVYKNGIVVREVSVVSNSIELVLSGLDNGVYLFYAEAVDSSNLKTTIFRETTINIPTVSPIEASGCTESDSGLDYALGGSVTKGSVVLQDSCSLNRLGDGIDYVYEAYCDSSGNPRQIYYACLFGCDSSLRACKSSAPNQEYFEFGVGSSGISQSVNKTIAPGSSATFEAHVCFDPLNTVTRPVNLGTGQCPSSSTCSGALNGKVEGNCKYYNFTISTTAQTPLGHNTISVYGDAAGKIRYGALFNVNIQSQTPPPSSGGICSDSDVTTQYPDGKNWFTVGNTSLSPTNSTVDYCISSSLIREYYCDTPNTRNSVVQNCTQLGANYFCFQGKCA